MGSPLTITTIWACTGDAHPNNTRAAAQPRLRAASRRKNVVVMVISATLADPGCGNAAPGIRSPGARPVPVLLRRRIGIGERPQAELQHESVAKDWRRCRRRIGEGGD